MPNAAPPKTSSRAARRSGKRKSPRDVAEAELARGATTDRQFHLARARCYARECSVTWADDVWNGHDRDYAAEQVLRERGKTEPRVFTGSGPFKVKCARCRRDCPPQCCTDVRDRHGRVIGPETCDDCKFESGSAYMLENTPGSSGRQLRGDS